MTSRMTEFEQAVGWLRERLRLAALTEMGRQDALRANDEGPDGAGPSQDG